MSGERPRETFLDAARGFLMLLGVGLHASYVYTISGQWLVSDAANRSVFFDVLASTIHAFRMPTFFWISGYFVAMTFERSGWRGLVSARLPRIAVPLTTTWITINVIQGALLAEHAHLNPWQAIVHGVPIGHLWFLLDLLVFVLAAVVLLPMLPRQSAGWLRFLAKDPLACFLFLAFCSYAVILAARATHVAYVTAFHVTSLYELATYAPFFAFGVLMYRSSELRERFLSVKSWYLVLALPTVVVADAYRATPGRVLEEALSVLDLLATWVCIAAALALFKTLFLRESPITRFLSDVSYTGYLFHQVLVVVVALALIDVNLPALIKFSIVCAVAMVFTSLIHVLLIRRSRLLTLLFNGRVRRST